MTVQELIDTLMKIKDKDKPVVLSSWSVRDPFHIKKELQSNMLIDQTHKLNILSE
jgi:hypothetical protein